MNDEHDDMCPLSEKEFMRRKEEKSAHDIKPKTLTQKDEGSKTKSQTKTASKRDIKPKTLTQKEDRYKTKSITKKKKKRSDHSQLNLLAPLMIIHLYNDNKINAAKKFWERIILYIRKMIKNECQNKKKKKDYETCRVFGNASTFQPETRIRYKERHHYVIYCKKSIIVLLLLCWHIQLSKGKIDIKLSNKFVVFGNDASLICTCDDNATHSITWIKEPENMLLTIGKSSLDSEKYIPSLMTVNERSLYILTIKNFSIGDFARYKCQVDFSSTLYDLSLDNRFVYRPGNDEIVSYLSKGSGFLNVTMKLEKVYPVPICEMKLEGYNYTFKASITLTKSSEMYVADLSTIFLVDDINCMVIVKINCSLSVTSFVLWRNFTICQEDDNRNFTQSNVTKIILVVVGSCFFIVLLLVIIYTKKRIYSKYTTVEKKTRPKNDCIAI